MTDVRKEDVKVIQHGSGLNGHVALYEARYGDIRIWSGISAEDAIAGALLLAKARSGTPPARSKDGGES